MRTLFVSDNIGNGLIKNHSYMPRPTRAIFNVGEKQIKNEDGIVVETKKVRVTVVYFEDGTKVTVTLSDKDTFNKETAILQAVAKRAYGEVRADEKGRMYVHGNGTGIMIGKIVKAAFDQAEYEAKLAADAKPVAKDAPSNKPKVAKSYYQKNRAKLLADRRERYHNDPEYRAKVLKAQKTSYKKNKQAEKRRAYAKSYYQKNRARLLADMKARYNAKKAGR